MQFDALILGGGIHGLCAAFHLRRAGLRQIAVLERFAWQHDRGSSHGTSRITRSTYTERHHVALAAAVHRDGWPLLERELGQRLLHATPGVFAGPGGGPIEDFARATLGSGVAVERLPVDMARSRFPLLRLADDDVVLLDHTAGVLAAATIRQGLLDWLQRHGVALRSHTAARVLQPDEHGVAVVTDTGVLRGARVVVAVGAWTPALVPGMQARLVVVRQQVGYFDLDAPAASTAVGAFPVFVYRGHGAGDFCYGLPEFGRPGVKLARHRTTGPGADPELPPPPIDEQELLALARQRFVVPVRALLGSEHCLYTMAQNDELRVEPFADDRRIAVVAACSGHAFKFGPEIGRRAAELVLMH